MKIKSGVQRGISSDVYNIWKVQAYQKGQFTTNLTGETCCLHHDSCIFAGAFHVSSSLQKDENKSREA